MTNCFSSHIPLRLFTDRRIEYIKDSNAGRLSLYRDTWTNKLYVANKYRIGGLRPGGLLEMDADNREYFT